MLHSIFSYACCITTTTTNDAPKIMSSHSSGTAVCSHSKPMVRSSCTRSGNCAS